MTARAGFQSFDGIMKNWKVRYRGRDGKPVEEWFSAGSRDEAFAMIRERGINATEVEECKDGKPMKHGCSFIRPVAWGFIGVIVLLFFLWVLKFPSKGVENVTRGERHEVGRLAETAPNLSSKPPATTVSPEKASPKRSSRKELHFAETNGFSKSMMAKWRFEHRQAATWTNDSSKVEQPEYAAFDFKSEKEIICLLTVEPGDMLLGDGNYGPEFERDFVQSLSKPIIVTEDDTPEQSEWKKMMIEAKAELKARMDAGESISEIMRTTRREYQRMAEMKDFLKDEIRSLKGKKGVTVQDIETCIDAANRLLESKGVSKLRISPLMRRTLLRNCIDYRPEISERN